MLQWWRREGAAATAGDKAVMKTIGLIGRMSWQSTRIYYDLLNGIVAARLGSLHSAEILMRSVDFAGLEAAMWRGDWGAIQSRLGNRRSRWSRAVPAVFCFAATRCTSCIA